MKGIRYKRLAWTVWRFAEDSDGRLDDQTPMGFYWEQGPAEVEAGRLNAANDDPAVSFDALGHEVSGVYPDDEQPPWLPDPERLARRGYEQPR